MTGLRTYWDVLTRLGHGDEVAEQKAAYKAIAGSLPADHPERAKREDITYARYRCLTCNHPWTLAIFEGEIPEGANVCRCGANGRLEGRS